MKILHAFHLISVRHGGGTADLVAKLTKGLARRGHDVILYTSDYQVDKEHASSLSGVGLCLFRSWLYLPEITFTPGIITAARKGLKQFDIIHLHVFRSFQNIVICHYARKYGIPYIIDAHGSTQQKFPQDNKWKPLLRRLFDHAVGYDILKGASKVIAQTRLGVAEYQELGMPADRIALIRPLFDMEAFSQLPPCGTFRNKYALNDKKIVLFLGRINRVKGIDFLIEAFGELTKREKDVLLAIVGPDEGFKSSLDRTINDLNLSDKVLFTGFLGGQDKLSALVDADVMVQTSMYEQGAWAPFEGVLCGTPIIVAGHTGAGEDVKNNDAGYLVEYGNKRELAEMIQYVLCNRAEARLKTEKARKIISSEYSLEKGIERYEQLYKTCIEAARADHRG